MEHSYRIYNHKKKKKYLRRPPEKNEEFRLDRLLKRKAEEGVKIYIVVYKEMAVALTINSAHTKRWLQDLHPNIIGNNDIFFITSCHVHTIFILPFFY
jgi:hypothetical protein